MSGIDVRLLEAEKVRLVQELRENYDHNRVALQERVELRRNLAGIDARIRSSQLSARQLDVLEGVAAGETNLEIAVRLFLAEETIKTHMKTIKAKLGARNRTHAVLIATRLGLIE